MITVWFAPDEIKSEHEPSAIIDTNELFAALQTAFADYWSDAVKKIKILSNRRRVQKGDYIQTDDGLLFQINGQGITKIENLKPFPHVGVVINFEENSVGDPCWSFPTLNRSLDKATLVGSVDLPSKWHYIEQWRWPDGQTRMLYKHYK